MTSCPRRRTAFVFRATGRSAASSRAPSRWSCRPPCARVRMCTGSADVGPLEVDQIDLAVKASPITSSARRGSCGRSRCWRPRAGFVSATGERHCSRSPSTRPGSTTSSSRRGRSAARRIPRDPSPSVLTKLLDDDGWQATSRPTLPPIASVSPAVRRRLRAARGVLVAFLNDEHLRYSAAATSAELHPDTAARWEAARSSDVARWHVLAQGVGLTSLPVPRRPPVRDPRGKRRQRPRGDVRRPLARLVARASAPGCSGLIATRVSACPTSANSSSGSSTVPSPRSASRTTTPRCSSRSASHW